MNTILTKTFARRISLFCLTGLLLLAVNSRAQTQTPSWKSAGPDGVSVLPATVTSYTAVTFDSTGTPYIAYTDPGNGNKAGLKKFDGTNWVQVGAAGFTTGAATGISLAFSGNTPWLSFSDGSNGDKATVMEYTGSQWITVGTAGFTAGTATNTSLAITQSQLGVPVGAPYLSFTDGVNAGAATVMSYTSGSWVIAGNPGFSSPGTVKTSMVVNPGSIAVLSLVAGAASGTYIPSISLLNGKNWRAVAGISNSLNSSAISMVLIEGIPFLEFSDAGNNNKATVFTRINRSWISTGVPDSIQLGNTFALTLAGMRNSTDYTPYEAFADPAYGGKVTVRMYNNSTWTTLGAAGFSADPVTGLTLGLNGTTPYVAYSSPGGVFIKTFTATPAVQAYSLIFSNTKTTSTTAGWNNGSGTSRLVFMAAGTTGSPVPVNGTTYKADSLFARGDQIGSTGWYCVYNGNGITAALTGLKPGSDYTVMTVESNGLGSNTTYLTTSDAGNLESFETLGPPSPGTQTWLPVGSDSISVTPDTNSQISNLVIDSAGVPYLAFSDQNYKVGVKRFNGTSWIPVGPAVISSGGNGSPFLAINGNTPYIAFSDGTHENKATVLKFDGTSWVSVGTPGFTAGSASYTSLAFIGTTPYLSFQDGANSTTVEMFNGSQWVIVGTPDFSPAGTNGSALYANANNLYAVSILNSSNGVDEPVSTYKFDGSNWISMGNSGLAQQLPPLAFNGNTPYILNISENTGTTILKYDGTGWVSAGLTGILGTQYGSSLAFSGSTPYVAYTDIANNNQITVKKYTGTSWIVVGNPGFSRPAFSQLSLVINDNNPYVAYQSDQGVFVDYFRTRPTVQATSLHFTNIKPVSTTASWTNGNGASRSVFIASGLKSSPSPADGTGYLANAAFATGGQIGASGWYCVYNGTDTTVNISGLKADSTYTVMTVESSGSGASSYYLTATSTGNPATFTTTGPVISTSGTPAALTTTYGNPSASSSFSVSGIYMLSGISLSAPAGFEISTDNAAFSATVTVGAAGTIASAPVYIRLKSSDVPGSYSGDIVLSSQEATSIDVATVTSTVLAPDQNLITATNILTPNGDGRNDTWEVKDILLFPSNTVTVFDRFNHIVFSASGYTNTWGGTYHGEILNEDTYYYLVDLGPGKRKFRGFITLLRDR